MTVQEPTTGNARPHEGDVEDRLQMGTDMLVWIRRGRTMRLELQGCGRGTGSLASALARLSQRSVWRTAGGGQVLWRGVRISCALFSGREPSATNEVAGVDADGPAMLKVYRTAEAENGEIAVLRALVGDDSTPDLVAECWYESPAGLLTPIAAVSRRLPGVTLDRILAEDLRAHLNGSSGGADARIAEVLEAVNAGVQRLHETLAPLGALARAASSQAKAGADRLIGLKEDLTVAVAHLSAAESEHGMELAEAAVRIGATRPVPTPGPCHGDLHLSQILMADRVRFVDFGRCRSWAAPADDYTSLFRAVECMTVDILLDYLDTPGCPDHAELARCGDAHDWLISILRHDALVTGNWPFAALKTQNPRMVELAFDWQNRILRDLCSAQMSSFHDILYLSRIAHELRYHEERSRTRYSTLAWCSLASLFTPAPSGSFAICSGVINEEATCM